jgi:hypothetical protein
MLTLLVEENGFHGMPPNSGGETGTATQINEIGGWATRWEEIMSIESILRRKGTDVTTIAPEASIKRAAGWLRAKNIGALVVTSGDVVLGLISEREIVDAFSRYGETAGSMPVKEIMQHGVTTVTGRECQSRDEADDAPSRAPHAGTTRWQAGRYRQHRRCSEASTGGAGA